MSNVIDQASGDNWTIWHADCVDVMRGLPDSSVHFSLHSPPYLNLYVYGASPRDVGNSRSDDEFWTHYRFVIDEMFRIIKPGRIACVDLMNVPAMKERDGYIGLKDLRGDVIYEYRKRGFIFHSEHCAWKDPLLEATRTKSLGLMHKQLQKDSAMCRAGIPQYLLAFRKPGANEETVAHQEPLAWYGENPPQHGNLSHERWRRYASPVWMDIDFTRTLNGISAREDADERHIAPMALDLIERAIELWSNPGDAVFDPFNGIGSTGVCAVKAKRKYLGAELKASYFKQAIANLANAADDRQQRLF